MDGIVESNPNLSDDHPSESEVMEISEEAEVFDDLTAFLNSIFGKFVDLVHPENSLLVDELRQTSTFTSDEEQQIQGEPTRRDKARKLWKLLRKVPPARFEQCCYPAIKAKYPHVLEGKQFCWKRDKDEDERCLRHAIAKTVMLNKFADLFPPVNGCTEQEFDEMTENRKSDVAWDAAFTLCAKNKNKNNALFRQSVKDFVERAGVSVPANFDVLLSEGFPCTCSSSHPVFQHPAVRKKLKVQNKLLTEVHADARVPLPSLKRPIDIDSPTGGNTKKRPKSSENQCRESSCGYPSTRDASSEERQSMSIPSSAETPTTAASEEEDSQETAFQSREDKNEYLEKMQSLHKAIQAASKVRPNYRELDGIKEELSIMLTLVSAETSRRNEDIAQIQQHRKRAKEIFLMIKRDFSKASSVKAGLDRAISVDTKKLLTRRQMLTNELNEASPFVEKAKPVYIEIRNMFNTATSTSKQQTLPVRGPAKENKIKQHNKN